MQVPNEGSVFCTVHLSSDGSQSVCNGASIQVVSGTDWLTYNQRWLGTIFPASLLLLDLIKHWKHQHNACTTGSQEIDTGNMHKYVYWGNNRLGGTLLAYCHAGSLFIQAKILHSWFWPEVRNMLWHECLPIVFTLVTLITQMKSTKWVQCVHCGNL